MPTRAPDAFESTLDLEWPIDGLEPLSFVLARVLDPLMAALVRRGRRAAALTLDLALVDGGRHPPHVEAGGALVGGAHVADAAAPRPRGASAGEAGAWDSGRAQAILAVTVTAEPTAARTVQYSLLDPAQPSPERLAELMARLHEWTSAGRGGAAALLDTHRPGAFAMEAFAPAGPVAAATRRAPGPRLALRAYRPPLPAHVVVRDGAPVFVSAGRRCAARSSTARGRGARPATGGTSPGAARNGTSPSAGGALFRIFNDRLRDAWFVDGELD